MNGSKDKRTLDKIELKHRILNAAREIFLEQGYDRTSVRMIAEKIGYSATTIYLHFQDKNEILHTLHTEGFEVLNSRMAVLLQVEDPFERLKAMGKMYIDFAMSNPELYDLMFIQISPLTKLEEEHELWKEGNTAFGALKHTVEECISKKYFPRHDAEVTAFVIWSALHGMITLHHRNRCTKVISEPNKEKIVSLGLEAFHNLLGSLRK
jgi:AcrR family transcriptional regulator